MANSKRASVSLLSDACRARNGKRHDAQLARLYAKPLPSTRTGPLYNAFPYPTKISPEAAAVFIASHTKPGDTVLDTFAGSGTTGLAALLCDNPTDEMKRIAAELGASPVWGPRHATLYEVGTLGAFVSRTMCNPPTPEAFEAAAHALLDETSTSHPRLYQSQDPSGKVGQIRHVIWTDLVICPACGKESRFWDVAVKTKPLHITSTFVCPKCACRAPMNKLERGMEKVFDPLLGRKILRKKRLPVRVYGSTGGVNWVRPADAADLKLIKRIETLSVPAPVPILEMQWGDLYRSGYHAGISHVHHFYTRRNLIALSVLWQRIDSFPAEIQDALRLLVLSYNTAHSTLMTRVVVKNGDQDFVLTGAQSGVLYVSSIPVEKNVFEGIRRKIKTFKEAFATVHGSRSKVVVFNASSSKLRLKNASVDYVFTDPPFGGYIPYAEINQISEAWLGKTTDRDQEIIVSPSQKKSIADYAEMMAGVFKEIGRVLKQNGRATVAFHSAQASIWQALTSAYTGAGFTVKASSLLDKLQPSFKQTVSNVSVRNDPLFLLTRNGSQRNSCVLSNDGRGEHIMQHFLAEASNKRLGPKERTVERLYSRYVARCLESGISVTTNADTFYSRARGTQN